MTKIVILALGLLGAAGCLSATSGAPRHAKIDASGCDISSLSPIIENALHFNGKIFCGEVFVRNYNDTVRVIQRSDEEPSYDVSFLVPADGRRWLGLVDESSTLFFIRARVEPQVECFRTRTDPLDEEGCVPFRRPVYLHISYARRRTASNR